jgi:aminopeptidase N
MSHPIRPESYISMDNFYTPTVYRKGAEVVRMYQTLLTREGFRKGMDLYFARHDGSAVTCDDFRAAMSDANSVDLTQFGLWYGTPGTPVVKYSTSYSDGSFKLTLAQSSQSDSPLLIPVSVGLLDKGTGKEVVSTTVLQFKETAETFTFDGLMGDVVPSLLRGFSAPVKLIPESGVFDEESVAFLAAHDTDTFNRWDSGQILYRSLIFQCLEDKAAAKTRVYVEDVFGRVLREKTSDYSIQAYSLTLPTEATLAEHMDVVDPLAIHHARKSVKASLARRFQEELRTRYDEITSLLEKEQDFKVDAESIGRRRLRNVLLQYICSIRESEGEKISAADLAFSHYSKATGMTDRMGTDLGFSK